MLMSRCSGFGGMIGSVVYADLSLADDVIADHT